jgi:hypothetical protein
LTDPLVFTGFKRASRYARADHKSSKRCEMQDVAYLAGLVAFFVVVYGFVAACGRLVGPDQIKLRSRAGWRRTEHADAAGQTAAEGAQAA